MNIDQLMMAESFQMPLLPPHDLIRLDPLDLDYSKIFLFDFTYAHFTVFRVFCS